MRNEQVNFKLSRTDILPIVSWISVFFMAWLFMHGADGFLEMTPQALGKYFQFRWVLIAHITAGGGALITGIIQFWPKLRAYSFQLHRMIGILYLLAILVSSGSALILAFSTAYAVNWAYAFTLQVWVTVWISATILAYRAALQKRFSLHREWMIRSYIITIAFLISGFAFKIPLVQQLGTPAEVSVPLFWMGWSVPLYIYEIIRSTGKKRQHPKRAMTR